MNQLFVNNYEIYVKEKQADYLEKAGNHRLEQEALQTSVRPESWVEKGMLVFGSWLIAKGERLQQRFVMKRQIPRFHESIKLAR
jgi:hypothetical protein